MTIKVVSDIFDLFDVLAAINEIYPPELLADRRAEFERQINEAETEELGHMNEWLGDSETVSEPEFGSAEWFARIEPIPFTSD